MRSPVFGREFPPPIADLRSRLTHQSRGLALLCENIFEKKKDGLVTELVTGLKDNFTLLSGHSNDIRQRINKAINTLSKEYTSIEGEVYKKEGGELVKDESNEHELQWAEIIQLLECYHHIQRNFYEISSIYQKLNLAEKTLYWAMLEVINPSQVAENFDMVIEKFSNNFLSEPARYYALGDLFRGYHNQKGRSLLDQTVISAKLCKVEIMVVPGANNSATIKIKENHQDTEAMATANLNDDKVAGQSPREYVLDETIYGKPGVLECVILQYTLEQNIVFLDAADTEGHHEYYLSESFVTVMHELGHMWSFLGGTNYHPQTPIPTRLEPFHTAEEYMTTTARLYCEDRFEPLNIQRVGHNAREFKSMEDFKENKEFLIDRDVKLQRQGECDKYLKGTGGEEKKETYNKSE
jgi:hypothetical protein